MAITIYASSPEEATDKFNSQLDSTLVYADSSTVDKNLELIVSSIKKSFPNSFRASRDISNFVDGRPATKIRLRDLDVTKHFGLNEGSIFINILDKVPMLCRVNAFVPPPIKFRVKRRYYNKHYRQHPQANHMYEIFYDDKDLYGKFNNKSVAEMRKSGSIEIEPIFSISEILKRKICNLNTGAVCHYQHRVKNTISTVCSERVASCIVKLDLVELGSLYHHLVGMINENVELNS